MRITRVYVDSKLSPGEIVVLENEAGHHLLHVLKQREGDPVHAFDGSGGYYESTIVSRAKKSISLRVDRHVEDSRDSPLDLTLVQGISRGQKMDYTIQKAVELGVRTIIPLLSDHSNVRLDSSRAEKRLAHWTGIIINACEQCGRNVLPEIRQPAILSEWLATDPDRDRLVLHPGASLSLTSFTPRGRELALICGTEGGLSEKELEICVRSGCHMVSMGPRTLRTETASIAAVAICQSYWGDIN